MKLKLFNTRLYALLWICAFLCLFAAPATAFDITSARQGNLQKLHLNSTTDACLGERSDILESVSGDYQRSSIISGVTDNPANTGSWEFPGDPPVGPAVTTVPTIAPANVINYAEKISAFREAYETRSRIRQISINGMISGPGNENPASPIVTAASSSATENAKSVVEANNRFGLDFYGELVKDPQYSDSNIFFSPWSIISAFAITAEGARGTTQEEIQSVFHFPEDDAIMRQGFLEVDSGLNKDQAGYTLHTANALWAEESYQFLPGYITTAGRYYSAGVNNLDFINRPEESRGTINTWVEDKTAGRITDLLPPGSIDAMTRLVITNAIYFKGAWDEPFDKENTYDETFRISPGRTVTVPMMRNTDDKAKYWYAETDTLQVLSMPYEHESGNELSMLVILPKDDDLTPVEQNLDSEELSELRQSLVYKNVKVYFPKFTFESGYSLKAKITAMGMPTAFTPSADFSGMDGTRNLFISDAFHKAFVEVNEEGTEAAAATAVVMTQSCYIPMEPVPVFRADHPFIFLIQDDETGNILFMGRVVDPTAS
jgi:serpin B